MSGELVDLVDTPDAIVLIIREFCEKYGVAESTFGRLSVNDGKLVSRIASGSRIKRETARRMVKFMEQVDLGEVRLRGRPRRKKDQSAAETMAELISQETSIRTPGSFAFHEQRQRFHIFASTTNESWLLADRIAKDLDRLTPGPEGIRIFYAPMDNGITLTRSLRAVHAKFPDLPVLVVLRGRGLEDLRNTMERLIGRIAEHPLSVFVLTNLYLREALELEKKSDDSPHPVNWRDVALTGTRSYDYQRQMAPLHDDLSREWLIHQGKHAQPVYARPSVVTVFREDQREKIEHLIPQPGRNELQFDYCLLNHPYLQSHTMKSRIDHILTPVSAALAKGGMMTVVQAHGEDAAHEIIQRIWPDQAIPFISRYDIIRELSRSMGAARSDYTFTGLTNAKSLFRFDMHTLPVFEGNAIGALSLMSAWNNAIYFAEVKEELVQAEVREGTRYLDITRDVLHRHGGLWFVNETFSVTRKNDPEE
jgi:hypothetical protein